MPNWCSNSVDLSHEDKTKIDALEAVLTKQDKMQSEGQVDIPSEDGVLWNLRPRPTEEEENWYGWNTENWGTKWDVNPHYWERIDENTISIGFDSAWGPPTTLYEYLTEQDWSVSARYEEPGMSFVGSYEDGIDTYVEYDFTDPDWRDQIDEELIDFAGLDFAYENWLEWQEEEEE